MKKSKWDNAFEALAANLDPDNKIIAAQDFRHTIQFERESVSDFIRRSGESI